MTKKYTIGEFADEVGLSSYTLRYYENEGLILPERDANDRRYYSDDDLAWLKFLLHLKGTGMTMSEIKEYVRLRALGDKTIAQRKQLLEKVEQRCLDQMNEIQINLKILSHKVDWYGKKLNHTIDDESFANYLKRIGENNEK